MVQPMNVSLHKIHGPLVRAVMQAHEGGEVEALHEKSFAHLYPDYGARFEAEISELRNSGTIAIYDEFWHISDFYGVVGLARCVPFTDYAQRKGLRKEITIHARTTKTREFLEGPTQLAGLKKICAQAGVDTPVVVKYYDNRFTWGTFDMRDDDTIITVVAVDARYRRHGIGSMLVQDCIKSARSRGSFAVYSHCYDGNDGASAAMLKKAGFEPIITLGPKYLDGSTATTMGLLL